MSIDEPRSRAGWPHRSGGQAYRVLLGNCRITLWRASAVPLSAIAGRLILPRFRRW